MAGGAMAKQTKQLGGVPDVLAAQALPDLSDAEFSLQVYGLLEQLARLGRPSSMTDRRKILNALHLDSRHSAFLGHRHAIEPPDGRGAKKTDERLLTKIGHAWLSNPESIPLPQSTAARQRRIRASLREFAARESLPVDHTGYVLASRQQWERNLWPPLRGHKLLPHWQDLHIWIHHLQSSQAFAFNLFGPLQLQRKWARAAWGEVFPSVEKILFEYPAKEDPLAETAGGQPHRTRVDVRVDFGANRTALVEVKFTEPGFGPCGAGHDRDEAHLKLACRAPGATLRSLAGSCFLAQHRSRGYFQMLLMPGSIVSSAGLEQHGASGCPLREGLYQVVRNLLMVDHVAREEGRRTEFVVAAPGASANRALHSRRSLHGHSTIDEFLRSLVRPDDRDRVRFVDFGTVVSRAAAAGGEAGKWAEYMSQKYSAALQ
jgi:hypothetical protein